MLMYIRSCRGCHTHSYFKDFRLLKKNFITKSYLLQAICECIIIDTFQGVICPGFYMGVVLSQSATTVLKGMVCAHKCSHITLIYA